MFKEFYQPSSAEEAVKLRRDKAASAYLGGGTILNTISYEKEVPQEKQAECIISLSGLPLHEIESTPSELVIGACVTLQELLESEAVYPALKEATALIVNRNIRNIGTIGGNVAFRGSTCNVAAMLLAMEASLEIMESSGKIKTVSLDSYNKEGKADDLILRIHIPAAAASMNFAVRRYCRTQNDISILLAYALIKGTAEKIEEVRLVMGGVDALPVRLSSIEKKLEGSGLIDRDGLAAEIKAVIHPIADLRGGAEFKREAGSQIAAWTVYKALGQL